MTAAPHAEPPTRSEIIRLRREQPDLTLKEVALLTGVTRQRVRQIADSLGYEYGTRNAGRVVLREDVELEAVGPAELRAWRRQHGDVTQHTLARMVGVTRDTVARWERGKAIPPKMLRTALQWWAGEVGKAPYSSAESTKPVVTPDERTHT